MNQPRSLLIFLLFACNSAVLARQDQVICATNRETWKEQLHLHRQSELRRQRDARLRVPGPAAAARAASRDIGQIVVMEDADGVVARRNEFNLDQRTITFYPSDSAATAYRFLVGGDGYDPAETASGAPLSGLNDDDFRAVLLPFPFPFFGKTYSRVFVNSDGNFSFENGDGSTAERSLGRIAAGPPRIAALFADLDPSRAPDRVRALAEPGRFTVTWDRVPEYQDFGTGPLQTFQIRLFPEGRIEISYKGIQISGAVVGISPGNLTGSSSVVSFFEGNGAEFSSTVAERFGGRLEVDTTRAAQKFYETHDDAYDYLVIFNNQDIAAGPSAVAFEFTVRNNRTGYGDFPVDIGRELGSRNRLQAVMNMGPLNQYPVDPYGIVRSRQTSRDTPMTVIAHEAGHLFLAYASVRDPADPFARPMLGTQSAHWRFTFNSEASILEGNRIQDNGAGASPRFTTVAAVEGFSPLDQYLMGLRAPEEVPPTFLVAGTASSFQNRPPQTGVGFDGQRRDIQLAEIIGDEGRRTPDHTVAQRHFRFAFLLIVRQGAEPTPAELAQIENYRSEFETFYKKAASDRLTVSTSLRRSLRLSMFPAAGVVEGRSASATLTVERPVAAALGIGLRTANGLASTPASLTIPAGATSVSFSVSGLRAGVEEITAEPSDASYEAASARIQIAPTASLRLSLVSGDRQFGSPGSALAAPVLVRVTDANELPYPGAQVQAASLAGGSVTPSVAVADESGVASFRWTPPASVSPQLRLAIEGGASLTATARNSSVSVGAVVNGASYAAALSPNTIASIFGVGLTASGDGIATVPWPTALAGVRVLLNGQEAPVIYVSDRQINFLVPPGLGQGPVTLMVTHAAGNSPPAALALNAAAPGIFFDASSGFGAVFLAGTATSTHVSPAAAAEAVDIYCTGILASATPAVEIAGRPAVVTFSGQSGGYQGLQQVRVRIPPGIAAGTHKLVVIVNGARSNEVNVLLR
jgi:uncharacterized protein (TIGR03437 family)